MSGTSAPAKSSKHAKAAAGKARRARMRQRLIEAGARAIAHNGHEKATIDDFIKEAKVARGTFYNHFSRREELLEALWASIGHDPFLEIQHGCRVFTNPLERFAAVTRRVFYRAQKDPAWGWLVVALSADKSTVNEDLRGYPLPDMKAAVSLGLLHYDDQGCAADLVVGSVRTGLKVLLSEKRQAHYPESLCKMILMALGLSRTEAHRISFMPLDLAERSAAPIPGRTAGREIVKVTSPD